MKRLPIYLLFVLMLFSVIPAAAQENVRVKCNNFTMNVPSANARCYQIEENIPLAEDASPADFVNAQIASTSIFFTDYENISSEIEPQATFYLIDDMTKTSFGLLDVALRLSDDVTNISSESAKIEDLYRDTSFMPYQNKERVINVLPEFLSFENGSGIRTVTGFDDPIQASGSASNLYYSFQGISSDGRYYISAVFPLMSVSLNGQSASNADWTRVDGADFQPSLKELDYYIRSIVIE